MLHRLVLLVLMTTAITAAENFFRGMTVAAHTDAATRDDIGELVRGASPGDIITLAFYAPEGYTMVSSDVTDHTPLGWTMIGLGRFRLVVPANKPMASAHEAEFFGKLQKDPTGTTGGGGGTEPEYYWGVRGKVVLTKAHEGLGTDHNRNPPADTTFRATPTPPTPRGPATCNTETEEFGASDGGQEFGVYTGALTTNPQVTGVPIPRDEQKPCPQDGQDQVWFSYMGVAPNIVVVIDPDTIAIDTTPAFAGLSPQLTATLTQRWNDMATRTAAHEDQHRQNAYSVGREAAEYLKTLRAYGYAPDEPRAATLARTAFSEFASWYISAMRERVYDEADALDARTDHGRR